MIVKPHIAGWIDGMLLCGDIDEKMHRRLDRWRLSIECFGNYNPQLPDCQRQDTEPCRWCRKIYYERRRWKDEA